MNLQHLVTAQSSSALDFAAAADAPGMGEPAAQGGLSLPQVIAILTAYWKQTLIIAVTVTCLAAVAIKLMPKSYTAVATLIANADNRDPLAAREITADMLASFVTTQTELMLSPVILLQVVDRLKLTEDKDLAGGFSGNNPAALRDFVEKNLNARLAVDQGRGGQLLYVSATAKTADRAAQIANAVADVYIQEEQRRMNGPAGERAQRYSEELAELRTKAAAAQDKVIQFQQQHGITDLGSATNSDTETKALDNLQQQLLAAQSVRRSLEAQTKGLEATTTEAMSSPLIQQLKDRLNQELTQQAQDSTVYGPRHPKMLELQSQIAATRKLLDAEVRSLGATNTTQLARARELEAKLTEAVATQRNKVLNLRQLQDEAGKLVLELDSAQAVYKRALDGYDQILFAAVANDSNVNIVSRATAPIKATKPNKMKLLLLGAFAGLGLGVVGPALYELFGNRRVRCRDDIERDLGIPVLALFEPIPLPTTPPT